MGVNIKAALPRPFLPHEAIAERGEVGVSKMGLDWTDGSRLDSGISTWIPSSPVYISYPFILCSGAKVL